MRKVGAERPAVVGTLLFLVCDSRIVIKLGTKAVFDSGEGVRRDVIERLARDVGELLRRGNEVVIVSSGAVGCGRDVVEGNGGIGVKQARAAVGQIKLMGEYEDAFEKVGLNVAQFLLNRDDLNSERLENIKGAYDNLGERVVSVINENDVTTTDELTFGDNDNLAFEFLEKFDFDVLLMLTEVGAMVSGGRKVLRSDEFGAEAYDNLGSCDFGSGGLESKLHVARKTIEIGKAFVVGRAGDSVVGILDGDVEGTWFCKSLKDIGVFV